MNKEQALAISDARERLVYAYVAGKPREVEAASRDLKLAQEMSSGSLPKAVVDRLIKNDPINAAITGLLPLPDLQEIVASDLDAYLTPEEVQVVTRNPAELRRVVAARISGTDLASALGESLIDKEDYALAARGDHHRASEVVRSLWEAVRKTHKRADP